MDTSRDDIGIAIRSALLKKGTQQKFSLFALIVISIILIASESINYKPINYLRSAVKDVIYRSSLIISFPSKSFKGITNFTSSHINLYKSYEELKKENYLLKKNISKNDYLELENTQLKQLIEDQVKSPENLVSARVMIDKSSLYLNSFILNNGTNNSIKKGMAVLDKNNFIGRIVDVNFFSSRVLLVTDLNSKIPVIIEPSGDHAILSGHGDELPSLDYLPKDSKIDNGNTVFTSGKEGLFSPGIPIGQVFTKSDKKNVLLYSDINQITFVNINIGDLNKTK
jgi:rod shape-determining protein MreC